MRKIYLILVFALCGCTTEGSVSRPACPKDGQLMSSGYVYSLIACGEQSKAIVITREGAISGSAEMSNLYIGILASNNDSASGLSFALRYAEVGDFESAQWVLRIAKKGDFRALDEEIVRWYISYISKSESKHVYIALREIIQYASSFPTARAAFKNSRIPDEATNKLSKVEKTEIKKQLERLEE